jgi:hypothetical protein
MRCAYYFTMRPRKSVTASPMLWKKMDVFLDAILPPARTYHDKITAYCCTKIHSLGSKHAVPGGFGCLVSCENTSRHNGTVCLGKIEQRRSESSLHEPQRKAWCPANIWYHFSCMHVAIGMNNLGISATNSVLLTLTYGLSATQVHLALPLILFGIGSMAEGHKSGQLSLLVVETLKSKEWVPRVYIPVYGIVVYCCEPVQVCLHVSNISIFSSPMRPSLVQVHWIHSFRRHGIKLWATCSLSVLAGALH